METLIHADIFFFVTTLSLIAITIGFIIALYYVIKILRDVSDVSKKVKQESGEIIQDIRHLRGSIKEQGYGFSYVKNIIGLLFRKRSSRKKKE